MPLKLISVEKDKTQGGFKSTQQKGNIVKGKLKSQKELKKITSSDEYKKADYEGKNKMLNVATHLTGGQAKLDKNKNNKIDAEDFKLLRKEKGKPMKAALGAIALGLGAKKMMDKKKMSATPGIGAAAAIAAKKKEILGKKRGGPIKSDGDTSFDAKMKAQQKGDINKKTGAGRNKFMKAAKSVKLGKRLLLPVAGAVAVGQYLKKKMKERKELKGDVEGSIAPYKTKKKMGGGMMQRPMAYAEGGRASDQKKRRAPRGQQATRGLRGGVGALGKAKSATISEKKPKILISLGSYDKARKEVVAEGGSPRLKTEDDRVNRTLNKVYGNVRGRDEYSFQSGGMMKPMGYKAGKSVKAKCKLGRNKPTKMY